MIICINQFLFGIVPFVPFVPDFQNKLEIWILVERFWNRGQSGQSGHRCFSRESLIIWIESISLWNCPVCPDCPHFQKYIRNLNSWRKVLKSGTKGTNGTNWTIFGNWKSCAFGMRALPFMLRGRGIAERFKSSRTIFGLIIWIELVSLIFGIVRFVPIVRIFKKYITNLNSWRKVFKSGTKDTDVSLGKVYLF